jgi:hypothetical protein
LNRVIDAEMKYSLNVRGVLDVFNNKLSKVVRAVRSWPRFAFHEEDNQLRSPKWKERYANKRVIMWDNTNVNFQNKPSDAELQRLTFSQYYGGNVAEGGMFLQLCGWLGGWELWLGAVSDTEYFERSGVLEIQQQFQTIDKDEARELAFTNILDKGYRCVLAAWRAGGQLLLQPFFAKSDRKFSSNEVLFSGAVATDRSANERAVNRLKASGRIAGGIHQSQDLDRAADMWIAWGFQCNFMFKPVL